ncbi:hypothetical protein BQ8420_14055 [Nocardiopsis sp. JB363]|nr:hypothetical protein BQ8420_14055 [Nocardiopsis sp. JB363]
MNVTEWIFPALDTVRPIAQGSVLHRAANATGPVGQEDPRVREEPG